MKKEFEVSPSWSLRPDQAARDELAAFGITDPSEQDACYQELADGLKRAEDPDKGFRLGRDVVGRQVESILEDSVYPTDH